MLQEGPSHERCERVVLSALKHQAECGAPQLQCTFNGAWGGPRVPKVIDWEWGMAKRGLVGRAGDLDTVSKGLHGRTGVAMHISQAAGFYPSSLVCNRLVPAGVLHILLLLGSRHRCG